MSWSEILDRATLAADIWGVFLFTIMLIITWCLGTEEKRHRWNQSIYQYYLRLPFLVGVWAWILSVVCYTTAIVVRYGVA